MSKVEDWSTTAGSNNSASPDGFPENMAPSGVNNSAREVMAQIKTFWEFLRHYIHGLRLSRSSATVYGIAVGCARDSTNAYDLPLTSAYTKSLSAWAVGTGNGSLDTGAVAANTLYAVWLIKRVDTDVVDVLLSTSFTAPTMPTDYTVKRLIGAILTDGSSQIRPFTQVGDYFALATPIRDVNDATVINATFETYTLSVPPDCLGDIRVDLDNATSTSQDQYLTVRGTGGGESAGIENVARARFNANGLSIGWGGLMLVNSSKQIDVAPPEGTGSATLQVWTKGWFMLTRRDPV